MTCQCHHKHYVRKGKGAHVTEHMEDERHGYIYRTWPLDMEFHPRPTLEVSDYCKKPDNVIDLELVFQLKQSIEKVKRERNDDVTRADE